MPNKISRFWQELKRRNVDRVVTVYAGAAFVTIELINNVTVTTVTNSLTICYKIYHSRRL